MSTSNRTIAIESVVAGALAAAVAVMWSPHDPWLGGQVLHPAWIAVLVLATRYGHAGLILAAPLVWTTLALTSVVAGAGAAGATRLFGAADLSAAVTAALVAAIATHHHGRQAELRRQRDELDQRARSEADAALAMREALELLRDRHDRIDLSVTFWRDIAARVQGGDSADAARAALQLAMVRTGARAGIVRRIADGTTSTVAWRGAWTLSEPIPRDIFPDRTITAAVERGRVVTAAEVEGAGTDDSDVAAPVRQGDEIVGVIALRGAPGSRLVPSALRDLDVVAGWVGPSLTRVEGPRPSQTAAPVAAPQDEPVAMAAGMGRSRMASGTGPVPTAPERPAARIISMPVQAPVVGDTTTDRVEPPRAPIPAVSAPPPPSRTLARRKGGAPRGLRRTYDYVSGDRRP